jgi:arabinogalactan endo-1,4-beta-galactosidase
MPVPEVLARITRSAGSVTDLRGAPSMAEPEGRSVAGVTAAGLHVTADVVVRPVNLLRNGSFEDSDTSMWTIAGEGAATQQTNDAFDGARAVNFWAPEPYEFTVSQRVEGLAHRVYRISATTQGADSPATDGTALWTPLAGVRRR